MDLIIDPKIINIDFKIIDLLVCAIFVKKHSTNETIKVFSNPIKNIVISLNKGANFVIIIIKPNKTYRLFGSPSI